MPNRLKMNCAFFHSFRFTCLLYRTLLSTDSKVFLWQSARAWSKKWFSMVRTKMSTQSFQVFYPNVIKTYKLFNDNEKHRNTPFKKLDGNIFMSSARLRNERRTERERGGEENTHSWTYSCVYTYFMHIIFPAISLRWMWKRDFHRIIHCKC